MREVASRTAFSIIALGPRLGGVKVKLYDRDRVQNRVQNRVWDRAWRAVLDVAPGTAPGRRVADRIQDRVSARIEFFVWRRVSARAWQPVWYRAK
jgi:hypothetical protein